MAVWLYVGFIAFVLVFMGVDLFVFGRRGKEIRTSTALAWTGLCVLLALAFTPAVYFIYQSHLFGMGVPPKGIDAPEHPGLEAATRFLQGWMLEYAMSIDNLFVFALIFKHFKVPREHQHRVLTWGIIATLVMRGAMIAFAVALIHYLHWVLYLAGAFLVYTGYQMAFGHDDEFDPDSSRVVALVRRVIPVTGDYHGDRFLVRVPAAVGGPATRWSATPLLLVLMVLNVVDLVFAVDSVPAIVSVTTDSFLVFTASMFAILGLRALYFVLAQAIDSFRFLGLSLAGILVFIGVKMLLEGVHHVRRLADWLPDWADPAVLWIPKNRIEGSPYWSLGVIVVLLLAGVAASVLIRPRPGNPA